MMKWANNKDKNPFGGFRSMKKCSRTNRYFKKQVDA